MELLNYRDDIRNNYPPLLNRNEIHSFLRVSKKVATWMLQNGYIQCTIQSKQYRVTQAALFEYLDKVERCDPNIRIPTNVFDDIPSEWSDKETERLIVPRVVHGKPPEEFKLWLDDEWFDKSDALSTKEVAEITGYQFKVVQRWTLQKKLKSVWTTKNELIITKAWLIDFYYDEAYKIQNKCLKHTELLMRYYSEMQT